MDGTFSQKQVLQQYDNAGEASADRLLTTRRAAFYDLVASQFTRVDGIGPAKDLNDAVRLLMGYTDIGFPRAKEHDDQLRALLYGITGVGGVAEIYRAEAASLRAGKRPVLDNPMLDAAVGFGCATGKDRLSGCVLDHQLKRGERLAQRFEIHSRNLLAQKTEESLPLIDEALRSLRLLRNFVMTKHPNG